MLLALVLATLLQTPTAPAAQPAAQPATRVGDLVLCGESFELPEALARELAGSRAHLVLAFDPADRPDPLAQSGTPLVRVRMDGEWTDEREREVCAQLARSDAVVLSGGRWLDWWNRLRPATKASQLEQELRAAQRAGRTLLGTGAGAAWLASWPIVTRKELDKVQRNPRQDDPNLVVRGLGLFENWIVDTSEQSPQGAEVLLASTISFGAAHALYLCGATAWIVREDGRAAEVAGPGCALVLDLSRARRSRGELRDARFVRLGAGDHARLAPEFEFQSRASGPAPSSRARGVLAAGFWSREALLALAQGDESRFDWLPRADAVRR